MASDECPGMGAMPPPKIILLTSALIVLDEVLQQPVALTRYHHGRGGGATRIDRIGMVVDTVSPLQLPTVLPGGQLDFLMRPRKI